MFSRQSRGCRTNCKLRQCKKLTRFKDVIFDGCFSSRRSDWFIFSKIAWSIFTTKIYDQIKIPIWFVLTISNDSFPSVCGLKCLGYTLKGPHILSALVSGQNCHNFLVTYRSMYCTRKGDLKFQNSEAPSRPIAMKKLVDKHSLSSVWEDSVVNAEPRVATIVVISYALLKAMKNTDEWKSAIKYPLWGMRKSHSIDSSYLVPSASTPVANSILLLKVCMADAVLIPTVSRGTL
jgi:hypothetical protein